MNTQFKDFINPTYGSSLWQFILMYDVMVTSNNCYTSGIIQSFHSTFIKMHQNVNINTFF